MRTEIRDLTPNKWERLLAGYRDVVLDIGLSTGFAISGVKIDYVDGFLALEREGDGYVRQHVPVEHVTSVIVSDQVW